MTDMAINRGDLLFNNRAKHFGVVISKFNNDEYDKRSSVSFDVVQVHWMDHRNGDSYIQNYYGDSLNSLISRNTINRYT